MSCFYLYRRVTSSMYSRHCEGNRSWRCQVVDISVFICGHMSLQEPVREALEGGRCVLEGLQFGDDPGFDECDWEVDKHNLLAMSSTPPSTSNFLPPIPPPSIHCAPSATHLLPTPTSPIPPSLPSTVHSTPTCTNELTDLVDSLLFPTFLPPTPTSPPPSSDLTNMIDDLLFPTSLHSTPNALPPTPTSVF